MTYLLTIPAFMLILLVISTAIALGGYVYRRFIEASACDQKPPISERQKQHQRSRPAADLRRTLSPIPGGNTPGPSREGSRHSSIEGKDAAAAARRASRNIFGNENTVAIAEAMLKYRNSLTPERPGSIPPGTPPEDMYPEGDFERTFSGGQRDIKVR